MPANLPLTENLRMVQAQVAEGSPLIQSPVNRQDLQLKRHFMVDLSQAFGRGGAPKIQLLRERGRYWSQLCSGSPQAMNGEFRMDGLR